MTLLLIIGIIIVAAIVLPRALSSEQTKLFRRVWSAEKVGGQYGNDAKLVAVRALAARYDVDFDKQADDARRAIGRLLADATEFDMRHRTNLGVQVMPAVAKTLLALKGERLPEIGDDLIQMSHVDGLGLMDSLNKTST